METQQMDKNKTILVSTICFYSKKKEILIDLNGFKSLVGFTESKYVTRMFTLFDEDCDGSIQFSEFVGGLSALSDRGSYE